MHHITECKITIIDHQLKKDIFDNKIVYNAELYNQEITDMYYNREKL